MRFLVFLSTTAFALEPLPQGPATKAGKWTGEGLDVLKDGPQTFEGFRWRTAPELAVSYFMLSRYVTENAYRQNNITTPPRTNRVWFDDIVITKE